MKSQKRSQPQQKQQPIKSKTLERLQQVKNWLEKNKIAREALKKQKQREEEEEKRKGFKLLASKYFIHNNSICGWNRFNNFRFILEDKAEPKSNGRK